MAKTSFPLYCLLFLLLSGCAPTGTRTQTPTGNSSADGATTAGGGPQNAPYELPEPVVTYEEEFVQSAPTSQPAPVVLRVLDAGFTAIGWLLLLVVGMLGMFAGGSQEDLGTGAVAAGGFSLIYFFTTFVGTAITCCMLVAGAELIKVVLDIQSNTLIAAKRA